MKLIKLSEASPLIDRSYSTLYAAVKRGTLIAVYDPPEPWGSLYTTRAWLRAYQRAVAKRTNGWGGKRRGSGRKRLEKPPQKSGEGRPVKPVTGL